MRILGIDLGSSGVKAVEIDTAFGRYEIHEYHEQSIGPDETPPQAAARLVASLPKTPDRITVSMRTGQVTFRNLQLPTRDKKAIHAAVGFEMDDELPFPADQSVYDYAIFSQNKQGTYLHVAATLKRHLRSTIEQWQGTGIDPDIITTEAWALRTFMNRILANTSQEEPVMVVQIGHERTLIYAHWRGQPVLAREYPWGGRDLTLAICQRYRIPLDQAEAAKLDHGFVIPADQRGQATSDQVEFSDTLLQAMQPLFAELKQAKLSCKNITHQNLKTLFLSGGTSVLPGLARVIEERVQSAVQPMQALSSVATSGVAYSELTDARFLTASALALSLVGGERAGLINFRRREYAKQGRSTEMNLAALRRPLQALGAVMACMLVSLSIQSWVYKSRLQEIDTRLERSVKDFFGQISGSAVRTYLSNTGRLKTAVNKEIQKGREAKRLGEPNPRSPLEFLKGLSAAVPKGVVVDLIQYQVGAAPDASFLKPSEQTATLTFLVPSPQVADELQKLLGPRLTGLQRGPTEEVTPPNGGPKRLKLTFSGKPTEESYGK